jgi:nitroreductase
MYRGASGKLRKGVNPKSTTIQRSSEEKILDRILEAGSYAAAGLGRRSPIMIAVMDKENRDRLSRMNAAVMGSTGDPFYGTPTLIVVLADRRMIGTYLYDGSLVMGNLMNAAHALGIASCWIHRAKEELDSKEGKTLLRSLGIEGDYEGIGHCILGYAAQEPKAPAPRKDHYIYKELGDEPCTR